MSLLTIVQAVADEVDILRPTSVISNNNSEVQKVLRLSNKVGDRLMKVFPWQILSIEKIYTSVGTEEQTNFFETDFDRFLPETMWNRSDIFMISGPITAQEWQGLKATSYSDTEHRKFRFRGDSMLIIPLIDAGKTIAYTYVSKNWCQSSGSVGQTAWAADDDTGILDEELITRGTIWEYLNAESLPNATQAASYEEYFELLIRNDRPTEDILVAGDIFSGSRGSRHYTGTPPVSGSGGLF